MAGEQAYRQISSSSARWLTGHNINSSEWSKIRILEGSRLRELSHGEKRAVLYTVNSAATLNLVALFDRAAPRLSDRMISVAEPHHGC